MRDVVFKLIEKSAYVGALRR